MKICNYKTGGRLTTWFTNGKMSTQSRLCQAFIYPGCHKDDHNQNYNDNDNGNGNDKDKDKNNDNDNDNDNDKSLLSRFTLEQYKSAYCNVITNTGEKCHQNYFFTLSGGRVIVLIVFSV